MVSQQMRRLLVLMSPVVKSTKHVPRISKICVNRPINNFQTNSAFIHTTNLRNNSCVFNVQDEDDFQTRVIESEVPVIVDFHAGWCGPCKLLGPRLETLVGSHNNSEKGKQILLAKVDIDEMPDIAMKYGVEAIPTVISVKGGKEKHKMVGLKEDDEIETFIAKSAG